MFILVVEDDPHLQKLLQMAFDREKWRCVFCESAEQALTLFQAKAFDLAVVDWMLTGQLSGLDLCKKIAGKTRIIMLTSRAEPTDVVAALENGADDFVPKPFDTAVLVARMRAVMRRSTEIQGTTVRNLKLGELEVFPERFEAKCQGQVLDLTPSEFGLLVAMLESPGCVLSGAKLLSKIQSAGINVVERTIDTHVYTLRKKIGVCGEFIETIRGVGYRIHRE